MPVYDAKNIPDQVSRGTLDPKLAERLKMAPRLGTHEPVPVQWAAHDQLIPESLPPIGRVEHFALKGPYGTIPVRCIHPDQDQPRVAP